MILFLDFDGVLHPDPCFDPANYFCCLPALEAVLREFPRVEVVITSTWRTTRSLHELKSFFCEDIQERIISSTPNYTSHPELFETIGFQRQTEIEAWLRLTNQPWAKWVVIDDKPYLFRPFLQNLVKTESHLGFNSQAEVKLRNLLRSNNE